MGRNLNQIYSTNPLTTFQSGDLFYVVRGTTNCATTFDSLEAAFGGGGGVATQITVANEASDTTCYPLFVTASTGDLGPKSNLGLTFNSATGTLFCAVGSFTSGGFGSITSDSISTTTLNGTTIVAEPDLVITGTTAQITVKEFGDVILGGNGAVFTTTGTSGITLAAPSTGSPIVYTLPSVASSLAPLVSPSFTTPTLGVAAATSIAIGGATIGSNALAVNGVIYNAGSAIRGGSSGGGIELYDGTSRIGGWANNGGGGIKGLGLASDGVFAIASGSDGGNFGFLDTFQSRDAAGVWRDGTTNSNALGSRKLLNLTATGTIKLGVYTFSTLPTPATGMVAYITDCNTATYNATAAAGGANVVKVFYNGTNWVVA